MADLFAHLPDDVEVAEELSEPVLELVAADVGEAELASGESALRFDPPGTEPDVVSLEGQMVDIPADTFGEQAVALDVAATESADSPEQEAEPAATAVAAMVGEEPSVPSQRFVDKYAGARRPDGQARRPRIPRVFEGGATPPGGMPRPEYVDESPTRDASLPSVAHSMVADPGVVEVETIAALTSGFERQISEVLSAAVEIDETDRAVAAEPAVSPFAALTASAVGTRQSADVFRMGSRRAASKASVAGLERFLRRIEARRLQLRTETVA